MPDNVSPELFEKARTIAISAPDVRQDKVEAARARMQSGGVDAEDVAAGMLHWHGLGS